MIVKEIPCKSLRISVEKKGKEIGHVFLQFVRNDLHEKPYGLIEDLFIHEEFRSQGNSKILMKKAIDIARMKGCHKLILTSRYGRDKLHEYYESCGFKDHGKEFRIDF